MGRLTAPPPYRDTLSMKLEESRMSTYISPAGGPGAPSKKNHHHMRGQSGPGWPIDGPRGPRENRSGFLAHANTKKGLLKCYRKKRKKGGGKLSPLQPPWLTELWITCNCKCPTF